MIISMEKTGEFGGEMIKDSDLMAEYSIGLYKRGVLDGVINACFLIAAIAVIKRVHKYYERRRDES